MTAATATNSGEQNIKKPVSVNNAAYVGLEQLVESGVADEIYPGAIVIAGDRSGKRLEVVKGTKLFGATQAELPANMTLDSVFDIGSLTGPVACSLLLGTCIAGSKIALDDRVARVIHRMGVEGKATMTVGHLLSHSSGLPQNMPFYDEIARLNSGARLGILATSGARQLVYDDILNATLRFEPGSKQSYSDLNWIILGQIIELLTGLPLDRAFIRQLAMPLGLRSTSFLNMSLMKRKGYQPVLEVFVPTGMCEKRERFLCGEPWDPHAYAMGGFAGHSGLFSTAGDLSAIAEEILKGWHGEGKLFKPQTLSELFAGPAEIQAKTWCYGWEVANRDNGLQDIGFSAKTVGCNSNTGCAVWVDIEQDFYVVVLSNAIYSGYMQRRFNSLRSEILKSAVSALK